MRSWLWYHLLTLAWSVQPYVACLWQYTHIDWLICTSALTAGAWGFARVLLGYVLWFLICWELFFSSCISIGSLVYYFLTTPLVGGEIFKQSYVRFKTLWRNANIVSWELLKTIPQSSLQQLLHNERIAKQLKEHSVLYRTFYYVLQWVLLVCCASRLFPAYSPITKHDVSMIWKAPAGFRFAAVASDVKVAEVCGVRRHHCCLRFQK